ncbi:unnamed protein product [Paramecium sonneborni]|uniref:Uncharacterized protein n=1 Tax=Paramecium sonneborni TaxID=65129 RepID=A0A8S1NL95_9CILI|nr:unnamed protein product [Paramecium sonneborni]
MWNIISINPICQKKKLVSDQERLLLNCKNMRKTINNAEPWKPSHSLSKVNNKYTNQEENKIMHQNNILLSKMMDIQRHNLRSQSSGQLPLSLSHVSNLNQRKFEKYKINQENQKFLSRLQSASSIYNKNYWQPDNEKNEIYKQIILKRTKLNQDYNDLARKSLESRSTGRMLSSQQFKRRQMSDEQFQFQQLPE